jgi:hypothetical protein
MGRKLCASGYLSTSQLRALSVRHRCIWFLFCLENCGDLSYLSSPFFATLMVGGSNLNDLYITSRGDDGTGKMYVARLDGKFIVRCDP